MIVREFFLILDELTELDDERIEENGYKSMPSTEDSRRLLAKLVGMNRELLGIPGFYTRDDAWTLAGPDGFLIPVRDKEGLIQGLKIRLDDESNPFWTALR